MKSLFPAVTLPLLLSACVVHVNASSSESAQHESQQLFVSSSGIKKLSVESQAGDLRIIGKEDQTQIDVSAKLYYQDKSQVQLSLQSQGDSTVLKALTDTKCVGICTGDSPRIDLVVTVPAALALQIEDGSGNISIHGMAADITIEDGSGAIVLDGGASVEIEDGSGEMQISHLSGSLSITDGSGSIQVQQVAGAVRIEDGSGEIRVRQVGGQVRVSDGSGSISVHQAGSFVLDEDGSGELDLTDIQGAVELNKD
ncbi:hypothetical protein [Rheinheimera sp.]|uniref:hypothetical protein n=1 Tax=Rheinheimera sp. TaxID=1869214 RepID=UPI00307E2FA8